MIKIINKAFQVGDKVFASVEEAQGAQIHELLLDPSNKRALPMGDTAITAWVMDNKVKLLDILTTSSKSRPSARKANGGTKTRVKAQEAAAAPVVAAVTTAAVAPDTSTL